MSGKTIGLIYFYVVSAASLALIVIGVFSSVNYLINITQFDKYPLRYRSEAECDSMYPYLGKPVPGNAPIDMPVPATPSAEEVEQRKQQCKDQIENERKLQKVEDLRNAITFTLIGLILFGIHFPLARKHSR